MKKIIIMIIVITALTFFQKNLLIPEESIRLRIIPNSNSAYDQNVKNMVQLNVEQYIKDIINTTDSIEQVRYKIKKNHQNLDKIVYETLQIVDSSEEYNINFGKNYFPEKNYSGISYKAGEYESLVITIGEGKGDNWWCVLFPPFCLMETKNTAKDVKYESFIKNFLTKNPK